MEKLNIIVNSKHENGISNKTEYCMDMKTKEIIGGIRSNDQCKGDGKRWMNITSREDFCCIPTSTKTECIGTWSNCTKDCGRKVWKYISGECPGLPNGITKNCMYGDGECCPKSHKYDTKTKKCIPIPPCPEKWTEWSKCSTEVCGSGIKSRRFIKENDECLLPSMTIQKENCNTDLLQTKVN